VAAALAAVLALSLLPGLPQAQADPAAPLRFETTVGAANGDAEEYGTAGASSLESSMQIGGYWSTTLTPAYQQYSAFRFGGVELPADAEIDDAYMEFTVQETGPRGRASDITIRGELGDADVYTSVAYAISARPYGQEAVGWHVESFTATRTRLRTPNLARLIDENRLLGWQSGQALAFRLEGTDHIGAVYAGGNATYRARLVIEYHRGDGPNLDGATSLVHSSVEPAGGWFEAPLDVTVTADPAGRVTYTLDGSDPGPGVGLPYTGPIPVGQGRTQLKVYVAGGVRDSGVTVHNYLVGAVPEAQAESFAVKASADDAMANATAVDLTSSGLALHSKYSSSRTYDTYLRFADVSLPADAVIVGARLAVTLRDAAPRAGRIAVAGEVTERGTYRAAPGSFKGRDYTAEAEFATPVLKAGQTWESGDLTAIVTAQYAADPARAAYAFRVRGLTPDNPFMVRSFNGSAALAPRLIIEYASEYGHSTTAIAVTADDAEEWGTGQAVDLGGSIQLGGYWTSANTPSVRDLAAFRFAHVQLPDSATLTSAYIQFTTYADGPAGRTSNLTIRAELGDAGTYTTRAGSISAREYSQGVIPWSVTALRTSRGQLRTPDLRDIIDEARLNGWANGGALAFLLDGDGFIGSVYQGAGADGPKLYLEYRFDGQGARGRVVTDAAAIEGVYINELSTSGTAANNDDWAELYNSTDNFIELGPQVRLWRDGVKKGDTFDFTQPIMLPPRSYTILIADEKPELGPTHLPFEFKKTATVNLTDMSSGKPRVIDAFEYGAQLYLETHARVPDGGPIALMAEESYGYSNDAAAQKFPLTFSHDRGVYPAGFTLTLSSVEGTAIRYTLDGSTPSPTKGTVYTGPFDVTQSVAVRAIAYNERGTSTPQTMTYVLQDNLKNEQAASNGRWTAANKATIDDAVYAAALAALPIVSVTSDVVELSHASTATYVQGYFEYIPEVGSSAESHAQPVGVKRFGQYSRMQFNSGIAIRFKKAFGAGKAKYQFFDPFEGEPYGLASSFGKLELAEGQQGPQPLIWYATGYLRYDDMMTRLLANQMGIFDSHAKYVHYFYNGQYAGIKTMREDFGPKTFEPYFGSDDDDYTKVSYQDACFANGCVDAGDGDPAVMRAVHAAAKSGNYQLFQEYVDVESLIRNMILFHYIDCENEWTGVVENTVGSGGQKMMFNINDSDGAFYNQGKTDPNYSRTMDGGGGNYRYKWLTNTTSMAGPGGMFKIWSRYDSKNPADGDLEFKTRVKDDVLELIGPASGDFRGTPGAPLSVDNVQRLLREQQALLETPYRLDAAYMGASQQWQKWMDYNPQVVDFVPVRTKFNLEQWAKVGLTHTLPAVTGESADGGVTLAVAADAAIYYTLDGTDPLGASGAISGEPGANPAAQVYEPGTVLPAGVTARAFQPYNWGPKTTL
jgi:hypothetical protein